MRNRLTKLNVVMGFLVLILVVVLAEGWLQKDLLTSGPGVRRGELFQEQTHTILCDSLLVNRTELTHNPKIEKLVIYMVSHDCQGIRLP